MPCYKASWWADLALTLVSGIHQARNKNILWAQYKKSQRTLQAQISQVLVLPQEREAGFPKEWHKSFNGYWNKRKNKKKKNKLSTETFRPSADFEIYRKIWNYSSYAVYYESSTSLFHFYSAQATGIEGCKAERHSGCLAPDTELSSLIISAGRWRDGWGEVAARWQ